MTRSLLAEIAEGLKARVGDSPTLKSYTDWEVYRRHLSSAREIVSVTPVVTMGAAKIEEAIVDIRGSWELARLHSEVLPRGFVIEPTGSINVVEIPSSKSLVAETVEARLSSDGVTMIRLHRQESSMRSTYLKLVAEENVKHTVQLHVETGMTGADYLVIDLDALSGSNISLQVFSQPGQMTRILVRTRVWGKASIGQVFASLSTKDTRIDAVLDTVVSGQRPSAIINGRIIGLGGFAALRGVGRVSKDSEEARLVYGFEALMLSEETRAFMHPFMEVYGNRVLEARHYAKTTVVTEDMLFYMATRGLAEDEARRMITRGIAVKGIEHPLRDALINTLESLGI